MQFSIFENIIIWAFPVLFAITFHEAAHAYVAHRFGDNTAKQQGRLSLNPIRHIDPIGTILVPIALLVLSGFRLTLGWAKPVPVNQNNFKNPMAHMAIVSFAGPASNIIMAFLWAMGIKLLVLSDGDVSRTTLIIAMMCKVGILINLVLAILNLIPIPPLDGSRILAYALPNRWVKYYYKMEPYGIFILLALLITGAIGKFMMPMVLWSAQLLYQLLGLQ